MKYWIPIIPLPTARRKSRPARPTLYPAHMRGGGEEYLPCHVAGYGVWFPLSSSCTFGREDTFLFPSIFPLSSSSRSCCCFPETKCPFPPIVFFSESKKDALLPSSSCPFSLAASAASSSSLCREVRDSPRRFLLVQIVCPKTWTFFQ